MGKMMMVLLIIFFVIFILSVSLVWYGNDKKVNGKSDIETRVIRGPQFYYPGKGNNYT